ncbi:hypothetical protein [Klenkia taihuensis]|uniref:Uncharacterized protein n=1 Tax=Klenkia taihuensis TaxID=1225127 RepID=A0A1I1HQX7_9ACTN|nr:hypothetical protein [Klenkia taihuensis]GHE09071.1 hypothetical protein GCM10011381_12200 [Klenkia taihuensis]SFC26251.1 hypothetical protein SAMN05661030_0516 [Klenkia taihuensis]
MGSGAVVVGGAGVVVAGGAVVVVGAVVVGSSSSVVVLGAVVVGRDVVVGTDDGVVPSGVVVGTSDVVVGAGVSLVGAGCSVVAGAGLVNDADIAEGSQAKNSATNSTARTTVEVRARPIRAGTRFGSSRGRRRVAGSAVTVGTGVVG